MWGALGIIITSVATALGLKLESYIVSDTTLLETKIVARHEELEGRIYTLQQEVETLKVQAARGDAHLLDSVKMLRGTLDKFHNQDETTLQIQKDLFELEKRLIEVEKQKSPN